MAVHTDAQQDDKGALLSLTVTRFPSPPSPLPAILCLMATTSSRKFVISLAREQKNWRPKNIPNDNEIQKLY